jgi:hypothetical protein
VTPEDIMCYIAGVAAHPAFLHRFRGDLSTPGLRIPLTADGALFSLVAKVGRRVIWLHTFGERMTDTKENRPAQPPRLPAQRAPIIPLSGEIPQDASAMPDTINYDGEKNRLLIGRGYIDRVTPGMWNYEVSGKQVLSQWFSYRKANRERPLIGDRRPPSPLGDIQPDYWLAEYTTELINLLNVLGLLIDLEPTQAELLDNICKGPTIPIEEIGVADSTATSKAGKKAKAPEHPDLFGNIQ